MSYLISLHSIIEHLHIGIWDCKNKLDYEKKVFFLANNEDGKHNTDLH